MITVNLYYKGKNGSARAFAEEMEKSGIADAIRFYEAHGFRVTDDKRLEEGTPEYKMLMKR